MLDLGRRIAYNNSVREGLKNMAKKSTDKNYNFTTKDGRCTLQMKEKGNDGRVHSISCEYPMRHDSGRKMSRKETIEFLLQSLVKFYPIAQ